MQHRIEVRENDTSLLIYTDFQHVIGGVASGEKGPSGGAGKGSPAQAWTSSGVQRLGVFADSLSQPCHSSPAHPTVPPLPCSCALAFPQPRWKFTEAWVPTHAAAHCFRPHILFFLFFFLKTYILVGYLYCYECKVDSCFSVGDLRGAEWVISRLEQIAADLAAAHRACGPISDHHRGPGPTVVNLYQHPNPVSEVSHLEMEDREHVHPD